MTYHLGQTSTTTPCDVDAIAKPQSVRLVDIFLLGPACLAVAYGVSMKSPVARAFWIAAGVGTIYYNARNYLAVERAVRAGEVPAERAWRLAP